MSHLKLTYYYPSSVSPLKKRSTCPEWIHQLLWTCISFCLLFPWMAVPSTQLPKPCAHHLLHAHHLRKSWIFSTPSLKNLWSPSTFSPKSGKQGLPLDFCYQPPMWFLHLHFLPSITSAVIKHIFKKSNPMVRHTWSKSATPFKIKFKLYSSLQDLQSLSLAISPDSTITSLNSKSVRQKWTLNVV